MKKIIPYLLILPLILLGLIFILGVLNGLVQSFGYIPAFGLETFTLDYYSQVFKSPSFIDSLKVSLKISLVSSILACILGTLLALSLVYTGKTKGLTLLIIKLAIIIPHTIVALFSISLLSQNGLLARLAFKFGMIGSQGDFPLLIYSENSLGIILGYLWKEIPFVAYFTLSLMKSIKTSLGEASENLGASKFQSFFYIVLPLSLPAIKKAFLIILTFSFGAYDLPFLLGPTLPKTLAVQANIEYSHPDLLHRPYAMAINGVILIFTWLLALIYYLTSKNKKPVGDRYDR